MNGTVSLRLPDMRKYKLDALNARAMEIATDMGLKRLMNGLAIIRAPGMHLQELAGMVREYASKTSREFNERFYGKADEERREYFPNGHALGEYMERLSRVSWFENIQEYASSDLQSQVDEITNAFKLPGKYRAKIAKSKSGTMDVYYGSEVRGWTTDALYNAIEEAKDRGKCTTVVDAVRNNASHLAGWDARKACIYPFTPRCACWSAEHYAGEHASFLAVENIIKDRYPQNPYENILHIFELGLAPVGIGEKNFIIWCPSAST